MTDRQNYLRRLPSENYCGQAYVHWSLTISERATGWLKPITLYKFRELLTHSTFRYGFCCPIFCLVSDHLHMMWVGILDEADQLRAMRHFQKSMNPVLQAFGCQLQNQAYDNVLKDDERQESLFEGTCEYIARNAERKELVPKDGYAHYKYSGCIVPGYSELKPFERDLWSRFWRTYSYLRKNGLIRKQDRT